MLHLLAPVEAADTGAAEGAEADTGAAAGAGTSEVEAEAAEEVVTSEVGAGAEV